MDQKEKKSDLCIDEDENDDSDKDNDEEQSDVCFELKNELKKRLSLNNEPSCKKARFSL